MERENVEAIYIYTCIYICIYINVTYLNVLAYGFFDALRASSYQYVHLNSTGNCACVRLCVCVCTCLCVIRMHGLHVVSVR